MEAFFMPPQMEKMISCHYFGPMLPLPEHSYTARCSNNVMSITISADSISIMKFLY